jgi:enoyl-[acyl-carrier protein] reductase I
MTGGGSVLTLTYLGAKRVLPNYNVMGVAKASLESAMRYLASELGPSKIRVNAISAGPVKTASARAIKDFSSILEKSPERAPLRRGERYRQQRRFGAHKRQIRRARRTCRKPRTLPAGVR